MAERSELIVLEGVTKSFRTPGTGEDLQILKGIEMAVPAGDSVALVGPSGCGKSTLLNIIGGLDRADSGKVIIQGEDLAAKSPDELARFRNQTVGFLFQNHHLLPQCSVLENTLVPALAFHREPDRETSDRAAGLLQRVGLGDRLTHRPSELSGGERQRVALVRSLVLQPAFILADEPTGSLDPETAAHMAELLLEMNRSQKLTLIVVTHSMELAAMMGRVLKFDSGRLVEVSADAHSATGSAS
jgi:ABC-type lipoprotein export system ATPase subunit